MLGVGRRKARPARSSRQWAAVIVTTRMASWRVREGLVAEAGAGMADVMVRTESPRQTIEGFGNVL
jgi:O-glycosyl hydrolase